MKTKYTIPPKNDLINLYCLQRKTVLELSVLYQTSISTIERWLKQYTISAPKIKIPPKNDLLELYQNKRKSFIEISSVYNVGTKTIKKWLKNYDIEISSGFSIPSYEELKMCCDNSMTINEMSVKYSVCVNTIQKWLTKRNLKTFRGIENNLLDVSDDIVKLHNIEKMPLSEIAKIYSVSDVSIGVKLRKLGYETIHRKSSYQENRIGNFLDEMNLKWGKSRSILESKKELDFYIPDCNLAIEYCGTYWHSNKFVSNRYHYKKYLECRTQNIQLLTIWDHEWVSRESIIKSTILAKCGIFKKRIYARQCVFMEIDNHISRKFLEENHLQGSDKRAKLSYGLFHDSVLIGVITYSLHHRYSNQWTLSRLAFLQGLQIIGGASKLFKNSVSYVPSDRIISWSDNRWSTGDVYKKLGFEPEANLLPDFFYINRTKIIKKQSAKNHEKTDRDKYLKVYDCGKIRWTFVKDV